MEIENVALNITTIPAITSVPPDTFLLGTLYARWLVITVWDQFKDPIGKDAISGDLYTGADITETRSDTRVRIPINQKLKADSTYLDPVSILRTTNPPQFVADNDPLLETWPGAARIPMALESIAPANVNVEVDGFPLNPAIVNRQRVITSSTSFTITWP